MEGSRRAHSTRTVPDRTAGCKLTQRNTTHTVRLRRHTHRNTLRPNRERAGPIRTSQTRTRRRKPPRPSAASSAGTTSARQVPGSWYVQAPRGPGGADGGRGKNQPPKRRAPAAGGARQSKLAKEHNVSAQEEGEIGESWSLFSEPMDGEKKGVMPIDDVKSALV